MSVLRRRLGRAIANEGTGGVAKRVLLWPVRQIRKLFRAAPLGYEPGGVAFDQRHGVDTAGVNDLSEFEGLPPTWTLGNQYQGVFPRRMSRVIEALPFPIEPYTFIDIGSGKGRAVLIALTHPFRKVIGVEFVPELHHVAETNLKVRRDLPQRCGSVELVCGDGTTYELPDGPLILFLSNPFVVDLARKFVANVTRDHHARPRPLAVLLDSVTHPEVWDAADFLTRQPDPVPRVILLTSRECLTAAG